MKTFAPGASKLRSPLGRVAYLCLVGGVALATAGALLFLLFEFHANDYRPLLQGDFTNWWYEFEVAWVSSGHRFFIYSGLVTAVLGWLFSFGYSRTVGKFINWIKTGSAA